MTNQELIDGLLEVREEVLSEGCWGCKFFRLEGMFDKEDAGEYVADEKAQRMVQTINSAIAALKQPIKAPCPACGDTGVIREYVERAGHAGEIEVRCPCGGNNNGLKGD